MPGTGDADCREILEDVDKVRSGEVILTVEPHLHIFNGLGSLQSESLLHKEKAIRIQGLRSMRHVRR